MAIRKAVQGKKNQQRNQTLTYYFDVDKCKNCALREGCYKEGAKSKIQHKYPEGYTTRAVSIPKDGRI